MLRERVALFLARTRYRGPHKLEEAKREAMEEEDWSCFGSDAEAAKGEMSTLSEEEAMYAWLRHQEEMRKM